jgi:hypothetical protein
MTLMHSYETFEYPMEAFNWKRAMEARHWFGCQVILVQILRVNVMTAIFSDFRQFSAKISVFLQNRRHDSFFFWHEQAVFGEKLAIIWQKSYWSQEPNLRK